MGGTCGRSFSASYLPPSKGKHAENEIKSAAALIRCLATNDDITSIIAQERLKKALEKIIVSGNSLEVPVINLYFDVKNALEIMRRSEKCSGLNPNTEEVLFSLSETALNILKPSDSILALNAMRMDSNCKSDSSGSIRKPKVVESISPKTLKSKKFDTKLQANVVTLGIGEQETIAKLNPIAVRSIFNSEHDYGFYDLSEHVQ
jgi:hypothetical protein